MTGAELRALREKANFTAAALSETLGYCPQRWSAFENERAVIPPAVEYAARWVCENELQNTNRSLSAAQRAVDALLCSLGLNNESGGTEPVAYIET